VDKIQERLEEIKWCNHLRVTPRPLTLVDVAHVYLHGQQAYLVVEENKVKLLCSECWFLSAQSHRPPLL